MKLFDLQTAKCVNKTLENHMWKKFTSDSFYFYRFEDLIVYFLVYIVLTVTLSWCYHTLEKNYELPESQYLEHSLFQRGNIFLKLV